MNLSEFIFAQGGGRSEGRFGRDFVSKQILAEMFPELRPSTRGTKAKKILEVYNSLLKEAFNSTKRSVLFRNVRNNILKYTPKKGVRAPYYRGGSSVYRGTGRAPFMFNESDPATNLGRFYNAIEGTTKFWNLSIEDGSNLGTTQARLLFLEPKAFSTLKYAQAVDSGFIRNKSYITTYFLNKYKSTKVNVRTGKKTKGFPPVSAKGQPGARTLSMQYKFRNLNRYAAGKYRSVSGQFLQGGVSVYGHQMIAAGFDLLVSRVNRMQEEALRKAISIVMGS